MDLQVSEGEDDPEYNPDQEMTDEEQSSDEEDGHVKTTVTFKSKNGNLSLSNDQGRLSSEKVIQMMTRGHTNCIVFQIDYIKS